MCDSSREALSHEALSFRASRSECDGDPRNLLFSLRQLMTAANGAATSGRLRFRQLPGLHAIIRLNPNTPIPSWAMADFTSLTRTADELSMVYPAAHIPKDIDPGPRWICLKLEGPFAFLQTRHSARADQAAFEQRRPVIVISSYQTGYVFVQEHACQSGAGRSCRGWTQTHRRRDG